MIRSWFQKQDVFPPFVPALWPKAWCSRRPCAPYDWTCCQQKGNVSGRQWQWQVSEPSNQISFEDHMKTKESTNFFLPSLPSRSPYLTLFLSCIPLYILADTLYKGEARRKVTIKERQAQGVRRQAIIMWLNSKTRMNTKTRKKISPRWKIFPKSQKRQKYLKRPKLPKVSKRPRSQKFQKILKY